VRLNSPGGVVNAAADVANIIRARGLNTYADRLCASACTVAFLAGVRREAAPGARIGFHQAYAHEAARERLKPVLRAIYVQAGLPRGFIDRALRTPPNRLWVPPHQALRAVGVLSATEAPDQPDRDEVVRDWMPAMLRLPFAQDATVLDAARTLLDVLEELQAASPDGCWGFMHGVATEVGLPLKPATIAAMASVERHVDADAPEAVAVPPASVDQVPLVPQLVESALRDGRGPIVAALLPDGDHAAFCPAFRRLILAATDLPAATRQRALRSLLASG
jgi:hypothetical protein